MAKVLNQQLYSAFVYGGELAAGTLRLESTSAVTKGLVQIVATQLQLIIGGQTGAFVHANTASRTYTLPDVDGEVFVSGRFTLANQMVYSSAPGTFAILTTIASSVLVSTTGGVPTWAPSGTNGQVLTVVAGTPQFVTPADQGSVGTSATGETLPYYAVAGNDLSPLLTVPSRVLLSTATTLNWSLLTAPYLATTGALPLANGLLGQYLTADGSGNFTWTTPSAFAINPGTQFRVPYYSLPGSGQTLSESTWFALNETLRLLELQNQGRVRFYEAAINGLNFIDFRAPAALSINTSFILPTGDGAPGAVLQTDGAGNLSFVSLSTGSVNNGLINQLAFYAATGNSVSGLATIAGRVLLSPAGVPGWNFLTAPYLATTGGVSLGNGTLNQVLTSDGSGNFSWTTVTTLTGQVTAGVANFLAYYPVSGATVDDSTFLRINELGRLLELLNGGQIRFYENTVNGSNFIQLQSPANLTANTTYILPPDGTSGYGLTTDGAGNLSWSFLGHGIVNAGTTGTLSVYTGSTIDGFGILNTFPNTVSSVLLTSNANALTWGLISTQYVSTTGGIPLDIGIPGQVLIADGAGNFVWTDVSAIAGTIQPGVAGYLAYYPLTGDTLDDSSFLQSEESLRVLILHMGGGIRFQDADDSNYVGFVGAPNVTTDITFTLPASDGVPGSVLSSNGAGQLTFEEQVASGVTDAVARYGSSARRVEPSSNLFNNLTGLLLTGPTFNIDGQDGANPTAVSISSGDGVGVNGADLTLSSGASDTLAFGTLNFANGSNIHASLSEITGTGYLSLHFNSVLRFDDGSGNYVGFKAAAGVSTVEWTLPIGDGLADQVLTTDGLANLSFSYVGHGTVNPGLSNAIAYYTGAISPDGYGIIDDSVLLLPTGLPATPGYSFTVDNLTGQINYSMLVQPNGLNGNLAFYTGPQTVSSVPTDTLFYNVASQSLELKDTTKISFYENVTNGSDNVSLVAPEDVTLTYTLTLPEDPPLAGQVLASDGTGQLSFVTPGSNPDFEKRGNVKISFGAQELTVIYAAAFNANPASVVAQWVVQGSSDPELLPTLGIDLSTSEGFSLRFSHPVPDDTYSINWAAYLSGEVVQNSIANVYLAGGFNGSPLDLLYEINMDYLQAFISTTSWILARGFGSTSSSSVAGYLLGGDTGGTSTDQIESFTYSTTTVAAVVATLPALRSSAGSLGLRSAGYLAGGETLGSGTLLSIAKFSHSTETAADLSSALNIASIARATAQTALEGVVVNSNPTSTIDSFLFSTETVTAEAVNFGAPNISVGCNNTAKKIGYFGRSLTSQIYKYVFDTDTITLLTETLSSTAVSSASNSLKQGIFTGISDVDSLSFSTETVALLVNSLPTTGHSSASSPTFQSRGLL